MSPRSQSRSHEKGEPANQSELPHLPRNWCWASLREMASIDSNLVSPADFPDYAHIAPDNIEKETGRLLKYRTIAEDGVTSNKNRFSPGHVLYSKIRPYLSKVIVADFGGLCSADMYPISTPMETEYLFRYMLSEFFLSAVKREAGNRVVLPKVNQRQLYGVPVPVAPLSEQKRIVSKIEALLERSSRAREALAEVGPLLEQFRQSVLAAAFRGELTADWRAANPDVEPATELLRRVHHHDDGTKKRRRIKKKGTVPLPDHLFHELPASWTYASVDDCIRQGLLVDFVDGNHGALYPRKAEFGDDGITFITAKQINDGVVDFESAPLLNHENAQKLQKGWAKGGDVLLTHNATVGRTARTPLDIGTFLLGTSVTYYRCNHEVLDRDYLFHVFSSRQWQGQLESIMEQTTRNQVSIQKQAFFRLPIAPVEEQREIARLLDEFVRWIKTVFESAAASESDLTQLDQSILARAFRGELVPQDPNDEPASVLLGRIRETRAAQAKKESQNKRTRKRPTMRQSMTEELKDWVSKADPNGSH